VVLPLLQSDLLSVMQAVHGGTLASCPVKFSSGAACCVVMASQGYPQSYRTGFPITLTPDTDRITTYVAGAKKSGDGALLTSGGRVLGVTATAPTLAEAVEQAYEAVGRTHFDNAFYRRDIGRRALRGEG
jgi:phosphoribosylamine--glycine ligase